MNAGATTSIFVFFSFAFFSFVSEMIKIFFIQKHIETPGERHKEQTIHIAAAFSKQIFVDLKYSLSVSLS